MSDQESLRFKITVHPVEDPEVFADLEAHSGVFRARRARQLMRAGLLALREAASPSANDGASVVGRSPPPNALKGRPGTVRKVEPAAPKTPAAGPLPNSVDAFDALELDVTSLVKHVRSAGG